MASLPLTALPSELLFRVLRCLNAQSLIRLERTCHRFLALVAANEVVMKRNDFDVHIRFFDDDGDSLVLHLENPNSTEKVRIEVDFTYPNDDGDTQETSNFELNRTFPLSEVTFGSAVRGIFDHLDQKILIKLPDGFCDLYLLDTLLESILRYNSFTVVNLHHGATQGILECICAHQFFTKLQLTRSSDFRIPEPLILDALQSANITELTLHDGNYDKLSREFFESKEFLRLEAFAYKAPGPEGVDSDDSLWETLDFTDEILDRWQGRKLRLMRVKVPLTVEGVTRWLQRIEKNGGMSEDETRKFIAFTPARMSWMMWETVKERMQLQQIRWDLDAAEFYKQLERGRRLRFIHHDTASQLCWDVEAFCEEEKVAQ